MEDSFRKANCLTIMLNLWQCRFICKTSRANGVEKEDLMKMAQSDDSECLRQKIDRQWEKQRFKQNPSFMRAFHRAFMCRFLRISFIGVRSTDPQVLSESMPPLYLYITKLFIDFVGDPDATMAEGGGLLGIFALLLILSLIFRHLFYFYNAAFGVVMRKALTSFIYQKLL